MLQLQLPPEFSEELNKSIRNIYSEAIKEAQRNAGINKEYLTIEEAMKLMGISRNTLTTWLENGLPKYKIDRKQYIKKSELYKFIDRHQV